MKRDKTGATPDNGWQVNADQIKQMVKEIEKMGGTWEIY